MTLLIALLGRYNSHFTDGVEIYSATDWLVCIYIVYPAILYDMTYYYYIIQCVTVMAIMLFLR